MDAKGFKLQVEVHRKRGASLSKLTDMWLSTWGEEEDEDNMGWFLWCDLQSSFTVVCNFPFFSCYDFPLVCRAQMMLYLDISAKVRKPWFHQLVQVQLFMRWSRLCLEIQLSAWNWVLFPRCLRIMFSWFLWTRLKPPLSDSDWETSASFCCIFALLWIPAAYSMDSSCLL